MSFSGRAHGLVDQALARIERKRRVLLTVHRYFTAGRVVANSDLLTVLPAVFVRATGFREKVVPRPLPFELPQLQVDRLWHQRSDRTSSQQWLRERVREAVRSAAT